MIFNYNCLDLSASHILGRVFKAWLSENKAITQQVFCFSAGPGCQVNGALAKSTAVTVHTQPLIKHTQISYVGNLPSALPVFQQLSTQIYKTTLSNLLPLQVKQSLLTANIIFTNPFATCLCLNSLFLSFK